MKKYTIKWENGKLSINGSNVYTTSDILYYIAEQHNINIQYLYENRFIFSNEIYYIISKNDFRKEISITYYEYWKYSLFKQKYLIKRNIKEISKIIDKFNKSYNNLNFTFDITVK